MFASTLSLFLFLVMIEALMFCHRSAANLKWRLAAEAFAYDETWEAFNHQPQWLTDNDILHKTPAWTAMPADRASVWLDSRKVFYLQLITPNSDATYWDITTQVRWPTESGGTAQLATPVTVRRYLTAHNVFRNTP